MTAALNQVRETLAAARASAEARRATVARRLAWGHDVPQAEVLAVAPTPEAVDAIEADVGRWRAIREAWSRACDLPAIEGEMRTADAAAAEKRARLTAEVTPLRRLPAKTWEQRQRLEDLEHQLFNAVRSPEISTRLRAAEMGWQTVLELMPERRQSHEAHQRALGRATNRLAQAEAVLAGLKARPVVERIRAKLSEFTDLLRWRPDNIDAPGVRSEIDALKARLESAPDEQAMSEREAQAEVDAARADLERLNSEPETFELVSADFAACDSDGEPQEKPAPKRQDRRRAEAVR